MSLRLPKAIASVLTITALLSNQAVITASANTSKELPRPVFTTSSGSALVQLNKTTKLILSAEGGQAVATYSTLTPDICSVSPEGVVSGLNGGTCSILASTTGLNGNSGTTPTVIVLTVGQPATSANTELENKDVKNVMKISRTNGNFVITLNFDDSYQNRTAQLQIGLRNSIGRLSYRGIASLRLDSKGNATISRRTTYAKAIYFRALVDNKVIAAKKID